MICPECNTTIVSQWAKKFCNSSCAAKFNNRERSESGWCHSKESKQRICKSLVGRPGIKGRIGPRRGKILLNHKLIKDEFIDKDCPYCQNIFRTSKYKPQKYCKSDECKYQHILVTRRLTRRSKAEIRLQELLSEVFDNVEGNNRSILGGHQVDIVLHNQKVVVEWDGIFHWRPIFSVEKFQGVKKHDASKTKRLLEKHWRVIRVKDDNEDTASEKFIQEKFHKILSLLNKSFTEEIVI